MSFQANILNYKYQSIYVCWTPTIYQALEGKRMRQSPALINLHHSLEETSLIGAEVSQSSYEISLYTPAPLNWECFPEGTTVLRILFKSPLWKLMLQERIFNPLVSLKSLNVCNWSRWEMPVAGEKGKKACKVISKPTWTWPLPCCKLRVCAPVLPPLPNLHLQHNSSLGRTSLAGPSSNCH